MKPLIALAAVLGIVPAVLGALERLVAPDADLLDPVWTAHAEGSAGRVDHGAWGAFLARYRSVDSAGVARIAYRSVSPEDRAALDAYIDGLGGVDPRELGRDEALAYWINLYNAATVDLILENMPLASIRDIGGTFSAGPWDRAVVQVIGRPLTLNDIEHGIIRPVFEDPRIHYAVNCAAVSCPNLAAEPWRGADLDARLDAAERAFIDDPRGVRLEDGELVLSKIWLWFREDFAKTEAGLLDRLRARAGADASTAMAGRSDVDAYAYDWSLNEAR